MTSRVRSALLIGSALGAALAAGAPARAACTPAFTSGPDTSACSGTIVGDVDALGGDDTVAWTATLPDGDFRLGAGDDRADMTNGEIFGNVEGGEGADSLTLDGTVVHGIVSGGSGGDTILLLSGGADSVDGGDDADDITLDGASIVGGIAGGASGDVILLSSGMAAGVSGDDGDDRITLAGAVITGSVTGGEGADIITLSGGSAGGIDAGAGADQVTLSGATINGILSGGADSDVILLSSGVVTEVDGGTGDDRITLAGAVVTTLGGGAGNDEIVLSSGSAATVGGGADDDRITLSGATVTAIGGGVGNDAITLSAGSADTVAGDAGDDTILLSGAVVGAIDGGMGRDAITVALGSVGSVDGGADADTLLLDGGTIQGTLAGGTGADVITLRSGTVAGVSGDADADTILLDGALVSGAIDGGAGADAIEIRSGLVTAVTGGQGADRLLVSGGTVVGSLDAGTEGDTIELRSGTVDGVVLGGDGDDTATVYGGFNIAAVESFDGGADTDTLRFDGVDGTVFVPLVNWERFTLAGGSHLTLGLASYAFGDGVGSPFDADGQGLIVAGGSRLGFFEPTARVEGDVGVAGTLDLRNGAAGDRLLVVGDYEGRGGRVALDGATAGVGDRLLVRGDATGRTMLDLSPLDRAAIGAGTVSLVQVGGSASARAFALPGGYVAGGVYQYRLTAYDPTRSDDAALDPLLAGEGVTDYWDYRLHATDELVPQIAGYRALPTAVLGLGAATVDAIDRQRPTGGAQDPMAAWAIVEGWDGDVTGGEGPDFDQRRWVFAAGVDPYRRQDFEAGFSEEAGLALYHSRSAVSAGDTDIDLFGWGLAGRYALTTGPLRVRALAAVTRWSAGLDTPQRGRLGTTDGWGVAASLEGGYAVALADGLTLVPHAGLLWQHARFDGFEDPDDLPVDLGDIDSLRLRAGATVEKRWDAVTAHVDLAVAQELLGDGHIRAGDVAFDTDGLGTTVTVGAGLAAALSPGFSAFADAGIERALDAGSNAVTGRIGVRWSF